MNSRTTGEEAEPLPLARRPDFRLGRATIQPSVRTIAGPAGSATVEPRVMQVLLALADARGAVLSRDDLLRICWGGRIVGDDAINRAIAEARRIAQATDAGFQIETIPRIGYRLTWDDFEPGSEDGPPMDRKASRLSRRSALTMAGGALAATAIGTFGFLAWRRSSEVQALVDSGKDLQARGVDRPHSRAAEIYRQATSLDPSHAEAWGLLALALVIIGDAREHPPEPLVSEAQEAAERALVLDSREPNARTALAVLRRGLDDWITFEGELRQVLQDAPDTLGCYNYLVAFLQGIGRCRDSWNFNERSIEIEPFSPTTQFRRALKHWIFGNSAEAERVSERAFELWPTHGNVWNARLTILAFTGRPEAGLRMVEDQNGRPAMGGQAAQMWTTGLRALATRSPGDIARTREICFQAATQAPGIGANGVMLLSELGDVDAAYQVAEGFLMRRGRLLDQPQGPVDRSGFYASAGWRSTQWLFTPATRALREDSRFTAFCESLGYTDYWRERRAWPDPFIRGSLTPT